MNRDKRVKKALGLLLAISMVVCTSSCSSNSGSNSLQQSSQVGSQSSDTKGEELTFTFSKVSYPNVTLPEGQTPGDNEVERATM